MITVLAYGDSNTYGYNPRTGLRYPEDIRWTGLLSSHLGNGYRVIEEGCNGRTTIYDDPIDGWKNGLNYLKPCLHSHKPVDIVVMMLGTNDLKSVFGLSAQQIAEGAGVLVNTIQTFTLEKYGCQPKIVLISPPEIGSGICSSPFYGSFMEDAIDRSRQFPRYYREVAERYGCVYLNAAEWIEPSKVDSLHLDPEAHRILAERLSEVIKGMY